MGKVKKIHWENVYQTKDTTRVGWFQATPHVSMDLILEAKVSKDSPVIDVGGGDGFLVDKLLQEGFQDITILDISNSALEKAKNRLGESASKVNWVSCDILEFETQAKFRLWHDRAVFHFLTDPIEQLTYRRLVENSIADSGYLLIMTFSKTGPTTCSGLPVQQYDITDLERFFFKKFELIDSMNYDHITPSGTAQNYSVCLFRKR